MRDSNGAIRVFIAIHISVDARQALAELIESLAETAPRGVRWVDPKGIHLTLKFLGDINPSLAGRVVEAMGESGRASSLFNLQLSNVGMFPNERQPRVLWAGIGGDLDALSALQEQVEQTLSPLGFPREKRPFNPHLTIGRVRDGVSRGERRRIGQALSAASLQPAQPWSVECIHLIQSNLKPQGAVYTSLGESPLAGS
ncbi:MAG: RNA 2',3'-cyclic phosphodiesterase [Chloroflexi bacterium]|nr:RNA 2',3'-cyclic phosphodiesterase [Chloroflexota bacterium]